MSCCKLRKILLEGLQLESLGERDKDIAIAETSSDLKASQYLQRSPVAPHRIREKGEGADSAHVTGRYLHL